MEVHSDAAEPMQLERVCNLLEQLIAGDLPSPSPSRSKLETLVIELAARLQKQSLANLNNEVECAKSLNETGLYAAQVAGSIQRLYRGSEKMAMAASALSSSVQSVRQHASSSFNQTGLAKEAIQKIRDQSNETHSQAEEMENHLKHTAQQVMKLSTEIQGISEVTQTIEEIASQTRLLALNAAIEAARAGEMGKGFAVVANEVKDLAHHTATSTTQIEARVQEINSSARDIVSTVQESAKAAALTREQASEVQERTQEVEQELHRLSAANEEIAQVLAQQSTSSVNVAESVTVVAIDIDTLHGAFEELLTQVDAGCGELMKLMNDDKIVSLPNRSLYLAQVDHVAWKRRVANLLIGRESLRPHELSSPKECRFGKWYYGEGATSYKGHTAFEELEIYHKQAHTLAKSISERYNQGDFTAATEVFSELESTSSQIISRLQILTKSDNPQNKVIPPYA